MTETSSKIFPDDVITDVQSTWRTINGDLQQVGYEVFQRLFSAFPAYQELFRPFKDVPISELKDNDAYRKHALSVATALNTALENLDKPDELVPILTGIGKKHVKRNVTPENFSNVQKVVYETIGEVLGDKFTDKVASSWNEVLAVAVSAIMKGNEEEEAKYI